MSARCPKGLWNEEWLHQRPGGLANIFKTQKQTGLPWSRELRYTTLVASTTIPRKDDPQSRLCANTQGKRTPSTTHSQQRCQQLPNQPAASCLSPRRTNPARARLLLHHQSTPSVVGKRHELVPAALCARRRLHSFQGLQFRLCRGPRGRIALGIRVNCRRRVRSWWETVKRWVMHYILRQEQGRGANKNATHRRAMCVGHMDLAGGDSRTHCGILQPAGSARMREKG